MIILRGDAAIDTRQTSSKTAYKGDTKLQLKLSGALRLVRSWKPIPTWVFLDIKDLKQQEEFSRWLDSMYGVPNNCSLHYFMLGEKPKEQKEKRNVESNPCQLGYCLEKHTHNGHREPIVPASAAPFTRKPFVPTRPCLASSPSSISRSRKLCLRRNKKAQRPANEHLAPTTTRSSAKTQDPRTPFAGFR
jgi:hypothetical protein